MSNFFEQELRKLFADGTIIRDPVFVGRACLGSLDRNRQVRAEFVTLGHADHYAALRLTLLDNNQGVVDKLILRFKDIWGKKKIPNNPYLRDGVAPHIWVDGDRIDWYAYHPSQEDYQQLRQIASDYVETFRIQVLTKNHGPRLVYICAPLRGELEKNIAFAKEKAQEVFQAGDIPICPHLMFPPLQTRMTPPRTRRRGRWACGWWSTASRSMCTVLCVHRGCWRRSAGRRNLTSRSRPTSQGLKRKRTVPGAARSDRR